MTDRRDLVLVTGLSGFIAKQLALALLRAGHPVRGTVRSQSKAEDVRTALAGQAVDLSRLEIVEADLDRDAGWSEAVAGVRFVHHTASPFPMAAPSDRFGLVATAKGGTLRVVDAAMRAGVERLILTSSVAAVYYGHDGRLDPRFTEADVSNVASASISPYAISKTLAERAARDAIEGSDLQMATINPALVLGPLLDVHAGTSVALVRMMMRGRMPFVPDIALGIVDVRDVAEAHLRAMTTPAAAGRRFLLSGGSLTLREMGATIAEAMPLYRRRMPRAVLPDLLVRLAAMVRSEAAAAVPELGRAKSVDVGPAEEILGLRSRDAREALIATARDLERLGLVGSRRSR